MPQFSFISPPDAPELAADVRELFDDLASSLPSRQRAYSGEWHPPLDVLETDSAVEIIVDVAGVAPSALRVLFRGGVVVVVGEKAPVAPGENQGFHLVEREFGRFARAVRIQGAFDVQRAHADVRDGELRLLLPKITERRDGAHRIPVTSGPRRPT